MVTMLIHETETCQSVISADSSRNVKY